MLQKSALTAICPILIAEASSLVAHPHHSALDLRNILAFLAVNSLDVWKPTRFNLDWNTPRSDCIDCGVTDGGKGERPPGQLNV